MERHEVVASIVMETTSEACDIKNLQVIKDNDLFYIRFYSNLQDFDVPNRNGRVYMHQAMMEGLNAPHIKELMDEGSWLGEFGHPMDNTDIARILTIDPKLCSHRITSIDVTSSGCKGWVETLPDGYGISFAKRILQGLTPAFSLRALAKLVRTAGKQIVKTKPRVVAYDGVILPSHQIAYRDKSVPMEVKTLGGQIQQSGVLESAYSGIVDSKGNPINSNTMEDSKGFAVMESQIIDFLETESTNIKLVQDVYEVCAESLNLTKDLKNVIMKGDNNQTYFIKLEDKLYNTVNNYMANF